MSTNVVGGTLGVLALAAILYMHGCKRDDVYTPTPVPVAKVQVIPVPKVEPIPMPRRKPVYHRVLKGGKVGGPVDCKSVPLYAKAYPKEEVLAAAKRYGLTPDQISQLHACLN